ncbi:MAG: glycosyltransferase family 2 protein [Aeromicrobium sp.]
MPEDNVSSLASVAVLVVNFGSHALVEHNLLTSVGEQFAGSVVVIDNFTSSTERAAIQRVCDAHGWVLVPSPTNEGFGGGNNLGARTAIDLGATELLFLNPDAHIDTSSIERLQAKVLSTRSVLVAPVVLRPGGALYAAATDLYLSNGEMLASSKRPPGVRRDSLHTWVSGACFMASSELWTAIGGFDEEYFLYWEDVDLSRRVVEAGGSVEVDHESHAIHDEGSTHGFNGPKRAKSPIYYYYNTRNRLMYAAKHLSADDQRRWLRATPRVSYRILLQGGRRQFIRPGTTIWPAIKGTLHGRRYLKRHMAGAAATPDRVVP